MSTDSTAESTTVADERVISLVRVDAKRFMASPLPVISNVARRREPLVLVAAGSQRFLQLNRPSEARELLALDGDRLSKSYGAVRFIIGNGILTSFGPPWHATRDRLQPAFQQDRLANMYPDIAVAFDETIERWLVDARAGQPIDIMRGLVRATIDVLLRVLAGTDGGMLDEKDIDSINLALLAASKHTWLRGADQRRRLNEREPGFENAIRRLDNVAMRLYQHQRDRRQRGDLLGAPDGDAVARLVEALDDPDCPEMTRRQLRDELVTFLLVGHETTAVALAWTLWLVGQHPEVQQRLRAEAANLENGMTAKDALAATPFASAVFREAMRLYPPIPVLPRICQEPVTLVGKTLFAGSFFAMPVFAYQRDPAVWPKPQDFMPERFLGSDTSLRDSPSYMPFGAGPRACLGSRFALTEGPLGLAHITRRIDFRSVQQRLSPIPSAVTLRPMRGPFLRMGPAS